MQTPVLILGGDERSAALFRLLERLLQVCRTVTVTLRMDPDGKDGALFAPDIRTYYKLQQAAEAAGSPFFTEGCCKDIKPARTTSIIPH